MTAQSTTADFSETDHEAVDFAAIYERHAGSLLRCAVGFVRRRDIAEELTNEAMLTLYQNIDHVNPVNRVPWLFRVLRNLAVDYWRRRAMETRHNLSLAATEPECALHPGLGTALLDTGVLKAEHRECLILRYVHGLQRREIAEQTGLTENQVKNCLQYGLELLRRSLREMNRGRTCCQAASDAF